MYRTVARFALQADRFSGGLFELHQTRSRLQLGEVLLKTHLRNSPKRYATIFLAVSFILAGCSSTGAAVQSASEEDPVTLTLGTAFSENDANNDGLQIFIENLKESAPWIEIDYKGGPEVMAPDVLIEGASSGVFDMASMPGDYYVNQMPAMDLPRFTPYTPMEERDRGITEIYDSMHRDQLGVTYLGRTAAGMPQLLLSDAPVDEADLQRKSIRTSAATSGVVQAINGVPVDLPLGEAYTSLERGVVSGASASAVGSSSLGLQEVVDYYVAPRFYESVANLVMSEKTWENLDQKSQQAITETIAESESEIFEHYLRLSVEETEVLEEAGVQETILSDEGAQRMLEAAYYENWQSLDWDSIIDSTPAATELKKVYEEGIAGDLTEVVPGGSSIEQTKNKIEALEDQP